MKTLIEIKIKLVKLFSLVVLLLSFGGGGGGLYAQDTEIFNHNWYFVTGELDGEIFFQPPEEHIIVVSFSNDEIYLCYPSCDECLSNYVEISADNFTVSDIEPWIVLIGVCNPPQNEFMNLHNSIYFFSHENSKNPFTYTIESVNDYLQLTITNGEGDWAVYNSVLLSAQDLYFNTFRIYPNPTEEVLNIKNLNNSIVDVAVYVFNINGKLVKSEAIEKANSNISLNVSHLKSGLYFLTIENKNGFKQNLKFVKQ
ncbi:T9SS type A sorting domain-containing protein [Haloflavibacter putidus]|uniref:T9SS type A sorting domain-containing protein n=1 Tax=Haloflavibacter putidus TaxID=2576776 RepID=A0A507ZRX4_9FLAO|nr:T9SS type A sorting domain-containing protein [Haloflavibacter putidus]TQD39034.1 T9SS type A sorting domain-containing protein [Haloflavibacter putidus]